MARIELDDVLEFLRKNGLSECESALMIDVMEQKSESKLLTSSCTNWEVSNSDDDDFLSLASSDFTKHCGIHTSARSISQTSSDDRLSQFDTAREDYSDIDMQINDLVWSEGSSEGDNCMPILFGDDEDIDCEPAEDKYIMSEVQNGEETSEDQSKYDHSAEDKNINYIGKKWDLITSEQILTDEPFRVENSSSIKGIICAEDIKDYSLENLTEEQLYCNKSSLACDEDITSEINFRDEEECCNEACVVADEERSCISNELLISEKTEEEYEIFELKIIHRKNRTGFEENKEFPIVLGSIIASRYYVTEFIGSSAFSRVVQAHDLNTDIDVCLKIIKNDKNFFDQSLDEIKLLKFVNKHDPSDEHHILRLYDYFYHQEHLFIVTELLRANLYEFQKYNQDSCGEPYFTLHRIQVIARQCLEALSYLHDLGIIHCDLKPENILIKNYERCKIKIIDLGSSCFLTDDNLRLYIQSRSYRAPEVILGLPYDHKIDLWSLGCILAELCSGEVLFPNEPVAMILARISPLLGPIDMEMIRDGEQTNKYYTKEYDLYHINEDTNELEYIITDEEEESNLLEQHLQVCDTKFIDFLKQLLEINPERRISAREALQHSWLSHCYETVLM